MAKRGRALDEDVADQMIVWEAIGNNGVEHDDIRTLLTFMCVARGFIHFVHSKLHQLVRELTNTSLMRFRVPYFETPLYAYHQPTSRLADLGQYMGLFYSGRMGLVLVDMIDICAVNTKKLSHHAWVYTLLAMLSHILPVQDLLSVLTHKSNALYRKWKEYQELWVTRGLELLESTKRAF